MSPPTSHQLNALRKLRLGTASWERAANYPGIGQVTWDQLEGLGYVEQRREGSSSSSSRLTEEGMRVVDGTSHNR